MCDLRVSSLDCFDNAFLLCGRWPWDLNPKKLITLELLSTGSALACVPGLYFERGCPKHEIKKLLRCFSVATKSKDRKVSSYNSAIKLVANNSNCSVTKINS